MKRIINWLIVAIVIQALWILPTIGIADQNTTLSMDEVLRHVHARQSTLTTFIADFNQVQQNELFAEPQASSGTLYFDRVGKLLIKMRQPETYVVLLTDGKMISDVPGSPTRQKNLPGGKTFLQKMLNLVQSIDQLKKQFLIQINPNPDVHLYTLELRPLKINRRMPFSKIHALIDSRLWLPINLHLVEPGGDSIRFAFQFTAVNSPLPENIFDIGPIDAKTSPSDDNHESK
jgi:outer membrane lipoprotein-sorting protein